MGDNHVGDSPYEITAPHAGKLAQAKRRYAVWRRLVMVGIGVGLFSVVVYLLHGLLPELRPVPFWIAVVSGLVGIVGLPLAILMASHAREQARRARDRLPPAPASELALYGLLYAGLVLGGFLVSVGLPSAGVAWLVQWFASHNDKPVPAVARMGVTMGLTAAIAGAGLLVLSLGFIIRMRRNETRDELRADGR